MTKKSLPPVSIAIDGNEANVMNRVGSNVYAFQLLKALYDFVSHQPEVSVTILLSQAPVADWPKAHARWQYQVVTPRPFWTQWALPLYLLQHQSQFQVFFTPGHYAPRWCPIPYVSSVMDLAFIHFPQQFKWRDLWQLTRWTNYSVKRAAKVVTISEFSKSEVVKIYHRQPDDVVVAYPEAQIVGLGASPARAAKVLKKLNIAAPYLVYIGTLQPRKNLERLVEAFEHTVRVVESDEGFQRRWARGSTKEVKLQLVLAGKVGWMAEPILARVTASPFADQIILTDFVDESTKRILLQYAVASVLVGWYEGFGMPVLESLVVGTVPVVANTTSLPEVVDNLGIQVDPFDERSIAKGLEKAVMLNQRERQEFKQEARAQAAKFSWHSSAKVVLQTLWEVAYQGKHG